MPPASRTANATDLALHNKTDEYTDAASLGNGLRVVRCAGPAVTGGCSQMLNALRSTRSLKTCLSEEWRSGGPATHF